MPVVKNIKQRTTNNSFNTYPIGMNAEFITIPAGTADLYENNVNADEGMGILKNYIDEQLSNARVSFFVDYIDMNNQVYNLRVYNDIYNNGQELRNTLNNLPQNISNLSIRQLYAPNFINASGLLENRKDIYNINNIEFINTKNTSNMFKRCINLSNINVLNLGFNIKNSYYMFYNCYNLINIPNFNTSNVIDMYGMFYYCRNLISISNFDTTNVINMSNLFYFCYNLINIPNLNTSKVTNMSSMFFQCSNLINVPNFNTINVTNMDDMFFSCRSLTNIPNFNTLKVTSMSQMFEVCSNLINISNFNTINVINMERMFNGCHNLINIPNFNTSNVTNIYRIFDNCDNLTNINKLNLNKVTEIYHMIGRCDNLSNSSILNIANSLPYYNNIINANKYNTLDYIGFSDEQISVIINNPYASNYVENHGWSLPKINYQLAYTNVNSPNTWINYNLLNQPITSNAKTLRDAFKNKNVDTANIAKLNVINLPEVTNGRNLFANNGSNYNFSKMTNVKHLNMQDLQDASYLFFDCTNLINASNFNMPNVTNVCRMFSNCVNLATVLNLNTPNITNTAYIFVNCYNLTTILNFNTSNVTNMYSMFWNCNNLTIIPNFNTPNVKDMSRMFISCYNLTNIPNFNTSNVEEMTEMFWSCNSLTIIPYFDTSNVTNMYQMFSQCNNLTTVPNVNTSNVTNMSRMFYGCRTLLSTPDFNTSNVTDMSGMFYSCPHLEGIYNFNTSNVTNMDQMFKYCSSLSNQSVEAIFYSLPLYENIINGNPIVNQYIGLTNEQIDNLHMNVRQVAENKGWIVLPQIRVDYTYINGVNGTSKIYDVDIKIGEQQYKDLYNVLHNKPIFDANDYTDININTISIISTQNNITNLARLFYGYSKIKNIDLSGLNTYMVTNISEMFVPCDNLINLPNFKTNNVINAWSAFYTTNFRSGMVSPNYNLGKALDIGSLYENIGISTLPNINIVSAQNMSSTFENCRDLINLNILTIPNVTNMQNTFKNCNNLSLNSLQNIIISIPDRDQIIGTTTTTNLQYIGLSATQINNLPTYYKQIAADKGWYVEGYEPKYTEMLVGTANTLGDITFEDTETYPMTLTYDDMFGDYCLENTNQGKANTTSSAILTVSEELLNVFDPMFRFLVYYSSESADDTRIYKNGELLYEYHGYDGDNYIDTTFWLEVKAGDVLKFEYDKDGSVDSGLDGCKIYISGWKNNKSYEVRYSTVDAPTTYITKFIPKEDN